MAALFASPVLPMVRQLWFGSDFVAKKSSAKRSWRSRADVEPEWTVRLIEG